MRSQINTVGAVILLALAAPTSLGERILETTAVTDMTSCDTRRGCGSTSHPGDRATTPDGSIFRLSAAESRTLRTPPDTYVGLGISLSTELGSRPQPVSIPVRSNQSTVGTETVFFEYVGVQVGPQAIDVYGTEDGGTQIETEALVGDLYVAVPSESDDWSPSSALDYDPRFGKAAGYILRYQLRGQLHTVGTLIVASDDDDSRHAVDFGSVGPKWSDVLGLDPADADAQFHFILDAPSARGFEEVGCNGAICENYCAAALPWEIEECGSACCSSGGSPGPVVNQCNDGIDNDMDDAADGSDSDCDHSPLCAGGPAHQHRYESGFNYMFTAKASWCSSDSDPFGEMWARSGYAKQAFRAGTGNAAFDTFKLSNDNVARPVAVKCWTFSNPDDAVDCDLNGNCGAFHAGSSNPYPFAQKSQSSDLFAAAIDDLHHSATVGLKQPVSLIQIIAHSFETDSGGSASGAADEPGRASVVLSSSTASTSAHEFGHSIGLQHCNADVVDGQWTLMGSALENACPGVGSHQRDHFGPTNGAALHQCLQNSCYVDPSF